MCKAVRKIVTSPFKLAAGLLAPSPKSKSSAADSVTEPEVPSRASDEVQEAAAALRKRMGRRQGFASTLLTGGQGVSPTPSATNTLLGGGG